MKVILAMLVILLMLVIIFSVQNPDSVEVSFLFWDFRAALLLVGLTFFIIGVAAGVAGLAPYYLGRRRESRRLRKEIEKEEKSHADETSRTRETPKEPAPSDPTPPEPDRRS